MSRSSQNSLTGLILVTTIATSSCGSTWQPNDDLCYSPFIDDINAAPSEVYSSDPVTLTATLSTTCPSSVFLQFPDYDSAFHSELFGYDASFDAIVLERQTDASTLLYSSPLFPAAFFTPGEVRYEVIAASGFTAQINALPLTDYFTVSDTESTRDTGGSR